MTDGTRPIAVSGHQAGRKIERSKVVQGRTGYSRAQVWRKSRDPADDFPAPIQLGANSIGWFEDEITAWLASRPRVGWAAESGDKQGDGAA